MIKTDILKAGLVFTLALGLIFSLLALPAFAQTNVVNQASSCKVRATVTSAEVQAITGSAGSYGPGQTLGLTGNNAGDHALICGFSLIKWVANIIFAVLISIAVLMIAYAAFLFVRSGDDTQTRLKARRVLLWAVVGLIVASIARLIPNIAMSVIVQ